MTDVPPPILDLKDTAAPSVFQPANLLREARRQRGLDHAEVPAICILDPDGDMVRYLRREGRAEPVGHWACYHTEMWRLVWDGLELGIVGCAVGAPFAVLVAEQMFASGCRFLISVTSSGQITPTAEASSFILIDRALRDEGTSYHYRPSSRFADMAPEVQEWLAPLVVDAPVTLRRGPTWTTDAPTAKRRRPFSRIAPQATAHRHLGFDRPGQHPGQSAGRCRPDEVRGTGPDQKSAPDTHGFMRVFPLPGSTGSSSRHCSPSQFGCPSSYVACRGQVSRTGSSNESAYLVR